MHCLFSSIGNSLFVANISSQGATTFSKSISGRFIRFVMNSCLLLRLNVISLYWFLTFLNKPCAYLLIGLLNIGLAFSHMSGLSTSLGSSNLHINGNILSSVVSPFNSDNERSFILSRKPSRTYPSVPIKNSRGCSTLPKPELNTSTVSLFSYRCTSSYITQPSRPPSLVPAFEVLNLNLDLVSLSVITNLVR